MNSFNLYNDIIQDIIDPKLNKIEAKNALSDILGKYKVKIVTNDPSKCDLLTNIEKYLIDRTREGEIYCQHIERKSTCGIVIFYWLQIDRGTKNRYQ